jgi:hypothetical protein
VGRGQDVPAPGPVAAAGVHQRAKDRDRPDPDDVSAQPGRTERAVHERDDLGIGRGAVHADQLDTDLGELAGFAPQGNALAVYVRGVADAERAGDAREARGHDASDRQGHLGAQGQKCAVGVDEPERHALERRARARLERRAVLDGRRVDRQVAPRVEHALHRRDERSTLACLLEERVSEPSWRRRPHAGASYL